jgi:hypothetical protein
VIKISSNIVRVIKWEGPAKLQETRAMQHTELYWENAKKNNNLE